MRLCLWATNLWDPRPGTSVRGVPSRTGHQHGLGVSCGRANTHPAGPPQAGSPWSHSSRERFRQARDRGPCPCAPPRTDDAPAGWSLWAHVSKYRCWDFMGQIVFSFRCQLFSGAQK